MGFLTGKALPTIDAGAAIKEQTQATKDNAIWDLQKSAGTAGTTDWRGTSGYTFDANGNPTGRTSTLSQPLQDFSTGLFAGIPALSSANWDFSGTSGGVGLDPNEYLRARMGAHTAYADPARDANLEQVKRTMMERGIPIGQEISNSAYGQVYDADTRGRTAAFGDAYRDLPGALQTMTNTKIAQNNAPLQWLTSGFNSLNALTPQARDVGNTDTAATNTIGARTTEADQAAKAVAAKNAAKSQLVQTGVGLVAAPFTGGASLSMVGGGSGGGLFNGLQGSGPSGPNGTYSPQQFQKMWSSASPSLPWATS